jgi:C4-dicarboxylate-specific signal transduction histidine kinase
MSKWETLDTTDNDEQTIPDKSKRLFTLEQSINKSLELLLKQVENNGITLNVSVSKDHLVYGVETELEQVILNLISNSIDAFNDKNIENKVIEMKSYSKQKYTIFTFEDNAGGIPDDKISKIFDPYYTTKEQGTGTGLYMVSLVIKTSFGGDLKVSNTDKGLMYTIALPNYEKK